MVIIGETPQGRQIDGGSLYAQYSQWTDAAQADPVSRSEFRRLLLELPNVVDHRKDDARGYKGIRLRVPDDK